MKTYNELLETIDTLPTVTYLKKTEIQNICDSFNIVKNIAAKTESKIIDSVLEIVSKGNLKAVDRKQLTNIKPKIIIIVKKYKDKYIELRDEAMCDDLDTDEVEALLDKKIPDYNKFNKKFPMKGVTWNAAKKQYHVKYGTVSTFYANLSTACNKVMQLINLDGEKKFSKSLAKHHFSYRNHYFVCYWHDNQAYFDIQHVISVLDLPESSFKAKYQEYSDTITLYKWHQNEFGGYLLRELITENHMCQLIMSASDFPKSFKKDVNNILINLCRDLGLSTFVEIINEPTKEVPFSNKEFINAMNQTKIVPYNQLTHEHIMYAQLLVSLGSRTPIAKYFGRHVLYAFILLIDTCYHYIIIKFGYTENLADRFKSLESEFKCPVYFVKAKFINGRKDEQAFHNLLKNKYAHLIESYSSNRKEKTELYRLNSMLMEEFDHFCVNQGDHKLSDKIELTPEEKSFIQHLKQQEFLFQNQMRELELSTLDNQSRYLYLISKEKLAHEQKIKEIDKEIKLKELELEHKKLDIAAKKIELDIIIFADMDKIINFLKTETTSPSTKKVYTSSSTKKVYTKKRPKKSRLKSKKSISFKKPLTKITEDTDIESILSDTDDTTPKTQTE